MSVNIIKVITIANTSYPRMIERYLYINKMVNHSTPNANFELLLNEIKDMVNDTQDMLSDLKGEDDYVPIYFHDLRHSIIVFSNLLDIDIEIMNKLVLKANGRGKYPLFQSISDNRNRNNIAKVWNNSIQKLQFSMAKSNY